MTTTARALTLAAILATTAAGQATPPAEPNWSMIVVQQKPDFVLWDADRKIEPGAVGLVYQVERVQRLALLLNAPGRGLRGWTSPREVISLLVAEDYFTKAIILDPKDPFACMMRGIVRAERGNADGAIADLDSALKRDPNYVPALVRRAAMLRARNQPDRALADLDRAIAVAGKDPSPYVGRAILRFGRKDLAGAWADLDRATDLGSPEVAVPIVRGQILLERRDTGRAYDAFTAALKIDPSRHDAILGLASVYLMQGYPRNAQAVLDDAVRADPNNPEAYGNRATFHLARGEDEKALFNLDEVIRLSPGSARAYNERAWLLVTSRDRTLRNAPRAVESATRACELSGWKNPRYLSTLAAACSETGDFAAAARNQERALSLLAAKSPEEAEYRRLLYRYWLKKPHHSLGFFHELSILSTSAARPAE